MAKHTFFCIDGHTCGEPVRLVVGGGPRLDGANQIERRARFMAEYDWIRQALMFEPRGHSVMSGAILYPPTSDEYDVAILYIETSGCLPMCGHGTIGTVTFALEHGYVSPKVPGRLVLETPAGKVIAEYTQDGDNVSSVKLTNVPSFLYARDVEIDHSELGRLRMDIAYGGNFYPIIEAQENFRDMADYSAGDLLRMGREVRQTLNQTMDIVHPLEPEIKGVNHCMWTGMPTKAEAQGRNAVIYGETGLDRSPCGTGTCARLAQLVAKGELDIGAPYLHESITHSQFTGIAEEAATIGPFDGIVPSVEGWAKVTGLNTIFVDDRDPFAHGFQII